MYRVCRVNRKRLYHALCCFMNMALCVRPTQQFYYTRRVCMPWVIAAHADDARQYFHCFLLCVKCWTKKKWPGKKWLLGIFCLFSLVVQWGAIYPVWGLHCVIWNKRCQEHVIRWIWLRLLGWLRSRLPEKWTAPRRHLQKLQQECNCKAKYPRYMAMGSNQAPWDLAYHVEAICQFTVSIHGAYPGALPIPIYQKQMAHTPAHYPN